MDGLYSLLLALLLLIVPGGGNKDKPSQRSAPPPPTQNLPVGQGVTPAVPSPALLPAVIGFGVALRNKKQQDSKD